MYKLTPEQVRNRMNRLLNKSELEKYSLVFGDYELVQVDEDERTISLPLELLKDQDECERALGEAIKIATTCGASE